MASYAKAIQPLLFAAALIGVAYVAFNPSAPVDAEARQAVVDVAHAVNALPQPQATVGQPPDEQWISERIINLPEDGAIWHTVLVLDNGLESKRLAQEFNTNPRLQSLATQTKFYQYSPDHWWVQKHRNGYRYPLVLIQRPSIESGGTNEFVRVYEQWGPGLPLNGDLLADDIAKMIGRPCPTPQPAPQPIQPVQPVAPVIPMTPDQVKPPEETNEAEWLIYALIAAGGLLGPVLGLKKEFAGG